MDRALGRSGWRLLLWSGAAVLSLAGAAWAVVPGLAGPLQALGQMLPQVLPLLAAGFATLLSSRAWRERLGRFGRWLATPRGMVLACVLTAAVVLPIALHRPANRTLLAAPAAGTTAAAGSWPMFRADLRRTGAGGGSSQPVAPGIAWSFRDPQIQVADLSSSPAVVGGKVYVGSAQASIFDSTGMVYCIDAARGTRIWQQQTPKQVFSSPAVVNGRVYIGEGLHVDTGCKVYCYNAVTGQRLWATPTRSHTESSPAVVGGRVYVGAGADGVYCLDALSGKPVWHFPAMHVDVSPAVAFGKVFVGTGYGRLAAIALDAATGKPAWTTPSSLPVWGDPSVVGKRVYYGFGNGDFTKSAPKPAGGVWCLDVATGKPAWRRTLPDSVLTAIVSHGDRLYAGCRDGKVYSLNAADGSIAWSTPCGGPVVSSPALDGAHLYAAGSTGKVVCLNLADGTPAWTQDLVPHTGPGVQLLSSPALAGGRLYLGTSKEKLFCLGR
jgi:outer membrane protein assembly factor BamB